MTDSNVPPNPVDKGGEFSAADRERARKFEQFLARQGYVRDPRGFWLAPGTSIETGGALARVDKSGEE